MVLMHPETFDKMFPKLPMHGRELTREEVWTEGHMKANSLMALLCSLEFMKLKGLKLNEYYEYLGKEVATTWDKSVFLTRAAKKTGAYGFLKTMILMFEGMLCNFDEGLDHALKVNRRGKEATLTMECFGAAVLKRFAEVGPKVKVDELCPTCEAIVKPVAARLGMETKIEGKPGEKCVWMAKERG